MPRAVSVICELPGSCRYISFRGRCSDRISIKSLSEFWDIISPPGALPRLCRSRERFTCLAQQVKSPLRHAERSLRKFDESTSHFRFVVIHLVAGHALWQLRDSPAIGRGWDGGSLS